MSPALFVTLSGCLTYGVPLMIAVHELRALRRGPGGGGFRPAPEPVPKPLPPCLMPVLPERTKARISELV